MRDLVRLPKAHLHVHLETSIRPATVRDVARGNGIAIPPGFLDRPTPGTAGGHRAYAGFADFADRQQLVRSCLRRAEDFERIATELCEDQAAQGVQHVEVTFTAVAHGERLGQLEMPLVAVLAGLAAGSVAYGISTAVVLDHSRRRSLDRAWRTFDLAAHHKRDGVVAIGLSGDEAYPLAPFREVFDAAADEGVHVVHHAGEHGTADDVLEAITVGRAERVGHGIRVLDDPAVVAEARSRAVPFEVCPTSNVLLGAVASMAEHPLPRMIEAGLVVTISTDGEVGLADELATVRDAFALADEAVAALAVAAVDASFAPAATKDRMRAGIGAWLAAPPRETMSA